MLLKKFIDFNSMWQYDSEELKNKIYKLLFDWKDIQMKGNKEGEATKDDISQDKDAKDDQ